MLNKKLAEMNENGTLPIFKNYLENISANPTKVKSLSDFAEDGWYEVTDVDGFEKYLVYHYAEGKKISVRYIFGKTPKIQEANPKGFFGEIADVISVFAYDSTLAVSKLKTEEGSAVKIIGYDTEGNLVEDDIPEGIVVDDALNTESDNAIANAPVATALNEKADTADLLDGTLIPNKALQAKSIEAVSTESGAVQDTPFIYQGTGTANGTSIADTSPVGKHLEKQGNSVVVNQLAVDVRDDSFTVANNTGEGISSTDAPYLNGHKYLVFFNVDSEITGATNLNGLGFGYLDTSYVSHMNQYGILNEKTTAGYRFTIVSPTTISNYRNMYIYNGCGADLSLSKFKVIDLTQWFAGNIPQDLLDHPENFFRYYNGSLAYNAGSMENGTGRYLTCGGRNVWDEEWEVGDIIDGVDSPSTSHYRSVGYTEVVPNATYYFRCPGSRIYIFYYDESKNFIIGDTWSGNHAFTTPANARYIRFCDVNSASYANNITISPYYETGDSYDQHYPYEEAKVYDTGDEELLSARSVRNTKAPDGTITKKVKQITPTAITGGYAGPNAFMGIIADDGYHTPNDMVGNILTNIGDVVKANDQYSHAHDSANDVLIAQSADGKLYITIKGVTTGTGINDWLSSHDLVVNYAVYEPTTEQGTPFAENIEINDYGTMGWDSEVPQGCKIFYPADYALAIDSLGQRPDINWDMEQVVSHTELNNETDALEAKDTQLLNAVGGTLRQLLAVSKSIDFANTAFVDLGDYDYVYDTETKRFYTTQLSSQLKATSTNITSTAYAQSADIWVTDSTTSGTMGVNSTSYLFLRNTAYTDATAFKAAMKGVLLAYEKASE